MRTYILKRLLLIPLNLIGITFIAFGVMRLAPGDPAAVIVGTGVTGQMGGKTPTKEALEKWRESHHLDQPIYIQFGYWCHDLVRGDFGDSYFFKKPVWDVIKERLPVTIGINVISFVLIYLLAIPIGIYSAWRPYTVADHAMTVGLFVLYSLPSFWVATMLIMLLATELAPSLLWLGLAFLPPLLLAAYATEAAQTRQGRIGVFVGVGIILPALAVGLVALLCWAGQQGVNPASAVQLRFPIGAPESHDEATLKALPWVTYQLHWAWHYFLAIFCLTYGGFAFLSRQMRAGMMECVRQDYIRTARAKGLPETRVILKHALRNSLIPIITLLGTLLPALLGGSVIIENIFQIRGMGLLIYEAIINRDYPVVIAEVFVAAILTLIGLVISDLLYVAVNPTITLEKAAT